MPRVRFEPSGKRAEASPRESLLEVAKRAGVDIESVCGGRGTCGRCQVRLVQGSSEIVEEERRRIRRSDLEEGVRLACQVKVGEDMTVEVLSPHEGAKHVILERSEATLEVRPPVSMLEVVLEESTLEDPRDMESRFQEGLSRAGVKDARIPLGPLVSLSLRQPGDRVQVVLRGKEVISIRKGGWRGLYGVAVDVGSTTVVSYLMELSTAEELAVHSQLNPQIRYGDDVISRITYSMGNPEGRKELQRLVSECVDDLIGRCCLTAGIDREDIAEVMMVGNTAMHHSVFGLDQRALTLVPFAPIASRRLDYKARDLGLGIAAEGYACALPNVAGFVGADHMAVLLATDLDEQVNPTMVIDIGTNGEISVGDRQGIYSASVAAGPAFEGGNLSCGMRGSEGAIDHVRIDGSGLSFTTIRGAAPRGLCGSGVIDLVAEMLKAGLIDRTGKIQEGTDPDRIRREEGLVRYVVADGGHSDDGREVFITQDDIVQIQFAKGALHAAGEILMQRRGVTRDRLSSILLAGAFGNYVNPASARTLGMLPEVPLDRIIGIGNAAGAGAKIALMSEGKRKKADRLAASIKYIELAAMPDFEERFLSSMYFPHIDDSRFPEVSRALRARG